MQWCSLNLAKAARVVIRRTTRGPVVRTFSRAAPRRRSGDGTDHRNDECCLSGLRPFDPCSRWMMTTLAQRLSFRPTVPLVLRPDRLAVEPDVIVDGITN